MKGLFLGLILYCALTSGMRKDELINIHLCTRCVVLIGCLRYEGISELCCFILFHIFISSGLKRSIMCVYNACRARLFVKNNRLLLEQAAHHGGLGVISPSQRKNGIPNRSGFEYPILSVILIIVLVGLAWWTRQYD